MTAAMSDLHPPPGGWTTDDLDELREDGHRYELDEPWLIQVPISEITPRFYRPKD